MSTDKAYSVWFKRTKDAEWEFFNDTNDFFDCLMMLSVCREVLGSGGIAKYF